MDVVCAFNPPDYRATGYWRAGAGIYDEPLIHEEQAL
jgi:hypothetical protein